MKKLLALLLVSSTATAETFVFDGCKIGRIYTPPQQCEKITGEWFDDHVQWETENKVSIELECDYLVSQYGGEVYGPIPVWQLPPQDTQEPTCTPEQKIRLEC